MRHPPSSRPRPKSASRTVLSKHVRQWDEFTGRVAAVEAVELRPRVSGYVDRVAFAEGQEVQQGRPAVRHRPASLPRRTRAGAGRDWSGRAARLSWRRAQDARAQTLVEAQGDLARGVRDPRSASARARQRRGARRRGRGRDRAAQPAVHRSALADRRPRRPRAGHRRQPRPGRRDAADHGGLAWIRCTWTSRATSRPTCATTQLAREGERDAGAQSGARRAGQRERAIRTRGTVDFVDNQVDAGTGTIRARAVLPNPDRVFTPGPVRARAARRQRPSSRRCWSTTRPC